MPRGLLLMNVLFLTTLTTSKACNSPLHARLFQTVFCFAFLRSYIFISDQNVNAKSNRIRNCTFHSLGNPKSHMLDYFFMFYISVITFSTNWYLYQRVSWNISPKTVEVHLIIGTTLVNEPPSSCLLFSLCLSQFQLGTSPRATPGKFFLSERIPATWAIFLSNSLPRGKKWWSNSRGWGKIFPNSKKLLFKLAKESLKN